MTQLNLHSITPETKVEGPFTRTALWLQGCSINCFNCANQHMLNPDKGTRTELTQIVTQLIAAKQQNNQIEGLTIIGGEPLEQAPNLYKLLQIIKNSFDNYGIIIYSGYNWTDIINDEAKYKTVLMADLLISGPYQEENKSRKRRWIGSDNQQIHYISSRYKEYLTPWPKGIIELEITFTDEEISVVGTPLVERKII